ncbi:MAG TPA: tetratricopeptide repeat protein [Holophagaceae bacterium]|nr:tetratricopeptide repeat protein [Holophagaceae bacterium]
MSRPWLSLLDPRLAAFDEGDRLGKARALNGRGLHREAAELLDEVIKEDRADPEAWFERVLALGDHFRPEEAKELLLQLESLRDERPADPALLRNLGYLRLLMDDLDGAERALQQGMKLGHPDPKSLELMGLLSLQAEEPQEAKAWLLKALSLQPKDPRTLRMLGLALAQLGDHAAAEAQLIAALELDPDYYWGWHTLGELLVRRGEFQEGLRCIHRARSLNVADPASYFIVAELMSECGHLEIALGQLHSLQMLAPEVRVLAEAQALIGELKRDLGDREGAMSFFTLAAETDKESANPWAALGDMAREDARWEDAGRCYREALARDPGAAEVQVQLGYVLLELDQRRDAETCFLRALEDDPGEYSAYLGLSECYRHDGRHEDQARMVKEAKILAPEDPDVWNAQGVVHELHDKLAEATEAYERALSLDPSHRKAANNLGFLLEKRMELGESHLQDRACEAWKRRLLICRDEGQSLRMAREHLSKLGVDEETVLRWLNTEMLSDQVEG